MPDEGCNDLFFQTAPSSPLNFDWYE